MPASTGMLLLGVCVRFTLQIKLVHSIVRCDSSGFYVVSVYSMQDAIFL